MQMKILRWKELNKFIGLSRNTVWRLEKAGDFPKRIQFAPRSVGWLEHEIQAWLAEHIANRRVEDLGAQPDDDYDESMDGDHASALASAGLGTDEDYGGDIERL